MDTPTRKRKRRKGQPGEPEAEAVEHVPDTEANDKPTRSTGTDQRDYLKKAFPKVYTSWALCKLCELFTAK
eukprot:8735941-Pyramimonas_sp.AAC.1